MTRDEMSGIEKVINFFNHFGCQRKLSAPAL